MTIQLSHVEYSSAAENHANARDIRRRLMGCAKAPIAPVVRPKPRLEFVVLPDDAERAETDPMAYMRYHSSIAGSSVAELKSAVRVRLVSRIRGAIAYALRVKFGLSYPEISAMLNKDHSSTIVSVKTHCRRHSLEYPNPRKKVVTDDGVINRIKADYFAGVPVTVAARNHGANWNTVRHHAMAEGWYKQVARPTTRRPHGSYDTAAIGKLYVGRMPICRIAENHHVSERTIRRLAKENGWKRGVNT